MANEKTEMQRHYVMVSHFISFLSPLRFDQVSLRPSSRQLERGQRDLLLTDREECRLLLSTRTVAILARDRERGPSFSIDSGVDSKVEWKLR